MTSEISGERQTGDPSGTTTSANAQPTKKIAAIPAVDYSDPLRRYQLLLISEYNGVPKAYIKDLLAKSASLIKVGETIGECKLIEIKALTQTVRMRLKTGKEFSIKRDEATK